MTFNWVEFLDLAEVLQQNHTSLGTSEACLRSAASRAYYAVFHYAVRVAAEDGYLPYNTGEDHRGVQRHFSQATSSTQARKRISCDLQRLHSSRIKADYDDDVNSPVFLAQTAVAQARRVIKHLDNLNKDQ